MEELGQALVTLCLVVAILYMSYRASKWIGSGMRMTKRMGYIKILDQTAVAQDKSIAVISAGKRHFLIGIASSRISVLSELSEEDLTVPQEETDHAEQAGTFKDILNGIADKRRKGK